MRESAPPERNESLKREAAASLDNASVREIPNSLAKKVILKYEYLRNIGTTRWSVGLIYKHPVTGKNYLGAVECFGTTGGSAVAAWPCGKEYADKVCVLTRGCCKKWSHSHAATWFINRACDLIAEKHGKNVFLAYGDESCGEIGTVYQGSNWIYVGRGGGDKVQRRKDGRLIGSKSIEHATRDSRGRPDRTYTSIADVDMWAAEKRAEGKITKGKGYDQYVEKISRKDAKAKLESERGEWIKTPGKHRYIHFAGNGRIVRKLKKAFKLKSQPYPKRSVEGDPIGTTNGNLVQSQETAPLAK
jgi:hypothetical protein